MGLNLYNALLHAFGCPTFTTFYLSELLIHFISSRFFSSRLTGSNFCAEFYQVFRFASLKVIYYSLMLKVRNIAYVSFSNLNHWSFSQILGLLNSKSHKAFQQLHSKQFFFFVCLLPALDNIVIYS